MTNSTVVCRSCGGPDLAPVLSLGAMPLANSLLAADALQEAEPVYPLDLVYCPRCTLVQITETVPPETLFGKYLYFSSFSDEMLRHAAALADRLVAGRGLSESSHVVEIASNDGYLLQNYKRRGIPVLGVEPAANIAAVASEERGIPTLCAFFDEQLGSDLSSRGQSADVIHANNVLAHVADLNGVVAGIHRLLKDGGVAVIETPYVKDLIDAGEFDTIYHEHLCYYSLTALDELFRRHGLVILDVERIPIHGGSLRVFAGRQGGSPPVSETVGRMLAEERDWGVWSLNFYEGFAERAQALRTSLVRKLAELKTAGATIAAYGAAAKGATLLNYCGIGKETIDFVVDRSPHKQGRYMPGVHIPICDPSKLVADQPDYALLLAWNFADEIIAQQAQYRRNGGRFIVPIPSMRVV